MLPLAHPNCTIRFSGIAGKGLLVQLTRLNVPCSSGHLQFTSVDAEDRASQQPPSIVCGKLEELPMESRTYYFRGSSNVGGGFEGEAGPETAAVLAALSVVNRAVFSVVYRTVDACYNTTLTDATRSIRLRSGSGSSEPLECYFRIHLPYGYRIKINIVTNFRDSHVTRSRNSGNSRTVRSSSSSRSNGKYRTNKSAGGREWDSSQKEREDVENPPVNSANYVYTSVEQTQQFVDNVNLLVPEEEEERDDREEDADDVVDDAGPRYRTSDTFMPITSDLHFNYVDNEQSNWRTEDDDGEEIERDNSNRASAPDYSSDCGPSGLSVLLWDGDSVKWSQCYDKYSNSQRISLLSNSNVVGIKVVRQAGSVNGDSGMTGRVGSTTGAGSERSGFPSLLIEYTAERIDASHCAFGWIGFQQFCLAAVYNKGALSWQHAENECQRLGGHLVSIRSRDQQRLIDRYLRRR